MVSFNGPEVILRDIDKSSPVEVQMATVYIASDEGYSIPKQTYSLDKYGSSIIVSIGLSMTINESTRR